MINLGKVRSRKDRQAFIYLPEKLYEKRYKQWVHPIYSGERSYFNPAKNIRFSHSDAELLLARRGGKPVGRIMALVNHRLNKYRGISQARFSHFDCVNDQEVADALLSAAEDWAREHGCDQIIGPLGFNNTDNQGILVQGNQHRGVIGAWWHPAYASRLIENAGYVKHRDWVAYLVEITPQSIPQVYSKIAGRVLSRTDYRLVEFTKRSQLKRYAEAVFSILNSTFIELEGFSPLTDTEINDLTRHTMRFIDPTFLKLVTLHGEAVAFSLSMPDITPGIQRARGRLFPFGFIHILAASRAAKRMDMIVGAILMPHRGKGLDVLMANALYQTVIQRGFTHVDSHQEQEDNFKVRGEFERLGGKLHKRYRVYTKSLP